MRFFFALLLLFPILTYAQIEACSDNPNTGFFYGELDIRSPDSLIGSYTAGGMANGGDVAWGDTTGLIPPGTFGEMVLAQSVVSGPQEESDWGCSPLTNADEVAGNIVLMRRGHCMFSEKALNAQMAGAIGFVVYDNHWDSGLCNMSAVEGSGEQVVIPGVFITNSLGRQLASQAGGTGGTALTATLRYAECYLPVVANEISATGEERALSAPYPNPFTDRTRFDLTLDRAQHVTATVHDVLGRRVAVLHDGVLTAGASHAFSFDAKEFPAGVYFVRFTGETFTETRSLVSAR